MKPNRGKRTRRSRRRPVSAAEKGGGAGAIAAGGAPPSASAAGRALFLLAASCAALNGSGPVHPAHSNPAVRGRPPRRLAAALRYRDGNEDQPPDVRSATSGRAVVPSNPNRRGTVPSHPQQRRRTPHRASGYLTFFSVTVPELWTPRPPPSSADADQLAMDEYILFQGARYSRLNHSEGDGAIVRGRQEAGALRPRLFVPAPAVEGGGPAGHQQDPLSVLGLSGLASDRLRQRLRGRPNEAAATGPEPQVTTAPRPTGRLSPPYLVRRAAQTLAAGLALLGRLARGVLGRAGALTPAAGVLGAVLVLVRSWGEGTGSLELGGGDGIPPLPFGGKVTL